MAIMLVAWIFQVWWRFIGPGKELFDVLQEQWISEEPSWPPTLEIYDIQKMSPQFQELWMISDTYILAEPGRECNLLAFHDMLFFEASFNQNEPLALNRVDLGTSAIVWQTALDPEGPDVMTHNANTIFLGSGIPGKITAFNVESGDPIWEQSLSWREKNIIRYMQATDDNLYVSSSSVNFNVLETHTGNFQEWDSRHEAFPIFYVDSTTIYHREIDTHLLSSDRITGHTVWEKIFDEPIRIPPVFTEELVVVKTGDLGMGQVNVIDRSTGEILWQRPVGKINWDNPANIKGNIAEDNDYIFYLTYDAQLQAVNANTGQIAGTVQFTPSLQELSGSDRVNREFCVAASDNVIVVYLGSGRQLFAFRFLPDE